MSSNVEKEEKSNNYEIISEELENRESRKDAFRRSLRQKSINSAVPVNIKRYLETGKLYTSSFKKSDEPFCLKLKRFIDKGELY